MRLSASILLLVVVQAAQPKRLCDTPAGMCSLDKVKEWRGNLSSGTALRDMLSAVTFRREIIVGACGQLSPAVPLSLV
jgi:hypothetical protein